MRLPLSLDWVAFAVPPFVVVAGDFLGETELGDVALGEELGSDGGVSGDEVALRLPKRHGA